MSIAENRKHLARLRRKRAQYHMCSKGDNVSVGKITTTPKQCSCWMCKNPRKVYNEESFQEVRQKQLYSGDSE